MLFVCPPILLSICIFLSFYGAFMPKMSEKLKSKVECSGNNSSEAKECGLPLEKLNLGPRKKLLVLSLGGLLCHRVHRYERANIPSFRYVDASYGSFRGIT